MIVWIGTNAECLSNHVTFYSTRRQAEQAMDDSAAKTEGRLIRVRGTILAAREGELEL